MDKPVIFSAPQVRALLEGRKTQDRRVLKPQPGAADKPFQMEDKSWHVTDSNGMHMSPLRIPYAPGDRLWVREAMEWDFVISAVIYSADMTRVPISLAPYDFTAPQNKVPSIFMPRWASRLTLTVTDVRVQRVQEISSDDAIAEGVDLDIGCCGNFYFHQTGETHGWPEGYEECCGHPKIMTDPRQSFGTLWDSLNASRGFGWQENPWFCAYTFTVEERNIDE